MEDLRYKDLETDIYYALEIINGNYMEPGSFGDYSKIYRFTNDPLNSYNKYLKDKKDVLAVTGSGDQILKCIEYGTKKVDTFDISNLPKYFLDLKIAAAKSLTRDEFYDMFYSDNYENNGSNELYPKLRDNLTIRSGFFWDVLLSKHSWDDIYTSKLFTDRRGIGLAGDKDKMIDHYSFLKENEYELLKERCKDVEINSFTSNISDISKKVSDKSYDLAFLSNIVDYVKVDIFRDYIKDLKINENGIILNTFLTGYAVNRMKDYQLLKEDGFEEEKTDRLTRLLVKKF